MAGLVEGAIVSQLLTSLIDVVRTFNGSKERLRHLEERLHRVEPLVVMLNSLSSKIDSAQAAGYNRWLSDLLKVLQNARNLVLKSQGHVKRMLHNDDLDRLNTQLTELLNDSAPIQLEIQLQTLAELRHELTGNFPSGSASSHVRDAKIRLLVGELQRAHDTNGNEASSSTSSMWKSNWEKACNVPELPKNLFGGDALADRQVEDILHGEHRKWIVMWGMGGVGKTCTALRLYHHPSIQQHFTGGAYWVTVSKDQATPLQILKQLYEEIKKRSPLTGLHREEAIQNKLYEEMKRRADFTNFDAEEDLQYLTRLYKEIKEKPHFTDRLGEDFREVKDIKEIFSDLPAARDMVKRMLDRDKVLLVLDDVWEPQTLKALDVISGGREGVILATTRDKGILQFEIQDEEGHFNKLVEDAKVEEVRPLSGEHSWQLFSWHAFAAFRKPAPEELKDVAEAVVEECKRLPLALKVIGSTMGALTLFPEDLRMGRTLRGEWQKALEQLQNARAEGVWRTVLEEHRRQSQNVQEEASLYGRLQWSVDNLAESPPLMDCCNYFAAYPEDFPIPVEDLYRMWGAEGLCREEEGVVLLGILVTKSVVELAVDGRTCRIHDVLRDLLRLNLNYKIVSGRTQGRRYSASERSCLYEPGLNEGEFPEDWTDAGVQLLAKRLSIQHSHLHTLPQQLNAPNLQVLMLGDSILLTALRPSFFRNLSNIRVLDLSRTNVENVPGSVLKSLKSLVLLDLRGCNRLQKISNRLESLEHFQILLLSGSYQLRLPRMKGLSKLHTLTIQLRYIDSWSPVGSFVNIAIRLFRSRLREVFQLRNLRRLTIQGRMPDAGSGEQNLPRISSLSALEELSLTSIPRLPEGLQGLQRLRNLELFKIHNLVLPPLDELPHLEVLRIRDCTIKDGFPASFERHGAFPSLGKLMIQNVRCGRLFTFLDGAMPKLQTLHLWVYGRLLEFPLSIASLPTLKCLHIFQPCIQLSDVDALFSEPACFPSLERLVFCEGFDNLNLPSHILERERQRRLKIEVTDFNSL